MRSKTLNTVILIIGLLIILIGTAALIYGEYLAIINYGFGWYFINKYRDNINRLLR